MPIVKTNTGDKLVGKGTWYASGNLVLESSGTILKGDKLVVQLIECGGCGAYHPRGFNGDCREDFNRFAGPEDYILRHGRK
jgi:hypothetical protein